MIKRTDAQLPIIIIRNTCDGNAPGDRNGACVVEYHTRSTVPLDLFLENQVENVIKSTSKRVTDHVVD